MMVYALLESDYDGSYLINVYTEKTKAELDRDVFAQCNENRGTYYHIVERTLIQCK